MEELLRSLEWMAWGQPREFLKKRTAHFMRMVASVKGNARGLVAFNIIWTLPNAFAGVYLSVYMKEQGLTEIEIGTLISAQLVVQAIGALLGGWLADRFGRLRTVTLVDAICWPLCWGFLALAHGYLAFATGLMLAGAVALLMPSWNSLYLQGVPGAARVRLISLVQLPWFAGSLIASLSGFLVAEIGVSATSRWVYGFFAVFCAIGVWWRGRYLKDPDPRPKPVRPSFAEVEAFFATHWAAIRSVLTRRPLLLGFLMLVLFQAAASIGGTYTFLYLTDPKGLALPKAQLAVLPLISGVVFLLTAFLVAPRITPRKLRKYLLIGLSLATVNLAILLLAPRGVLWPVLVASFCGSAGAALFLPTLFGFWASIVEDRERARLDSFRWVGVMLLTIPVPTFAGALFKEVHPSMTLLLILGCYAAMAALSFPAFRGTARLVSRRT